MNKILIKIGIGFIIGFIIYMLYKYNIVQSNRYLFFGVFLSIAIMVAIIDVKNKKKK